MIPDAQEHGGVVNTSSPEVTYTFSDGNNSALRKLSVSTPSGHKVNYDYGAANSIGDAFNRPDSPKGDGETGNLVEYEFIGLVLNSKIKYPTPDTELNTSYDRFARIIDMPWTNAAGTTTHAHIQYGYDAASRRTWGKDLTPHADDQHDRAYTYDALSQVKSADVGALNLNESGISGVPEQSESWTYDETGNWLAYDKDEDGTTSIDQSRRHNESNQITVIDGNRSSINHDLNGNTTLLPTGDDLQGPPSKLKWNPWNMLVEVRDSSDDSLINAYQYDGRFRRTTVTESDGTVTHAYYNDQWRQVEEREGTSTDPAKVHYWGALNRWELVRRDRDSNGNGTLDESLYCIKDAMDPIAVLDSSGTIQERYEYTAFGTASFFGVNFGARNGSPINWCFLFHGEFRDQDTEMYNYGFRYYDPETGRWPSRDPIEESGGVNLYGFVENDGFNRWDFLGKYTMSDARKSLERQGVRYGVAGSTHSGAITSGTYTQTQLFDEWLKLEKKSTSWLSNIPECPSRLKFKDKEKKKPCDCNNGDWGGLGGPGLHDGAKWCMRSKAFKGSAQQCCYDQLGTLMTELPAAGTPDLVAANIAGTLGALGGRGHYGHDVVPWNFATSLGRMNDYALVRPPSKGGGKCYKEK